MLHNHKMKIDIVKNQNLHHYHHKNHFHFDDNYQHLNKLMKLNNLNYVYY